MSRKAVRIISIVLLFSLVYAVVRYHIFEAVLSKDFALFVMNKCLGLTAFSLLTLTFALGPAKALEILRVLTRFRDGCGYAKKTVELRN